MPNLASVDVNPLAISSAILSSQNSLNGVGSLGGTALAFLDFST
jgi:hypothetical protein